MSDKKSDRATREADVHQDRAFVLRPGEGRAIALGAFGMTVKATGQDTGGAFSLLEADEPPGLARRFRSIATRPRRSMS